MKNTFDSNFFCIAAGVDTSSLHAESNYWRRWPLKHFSISISIIEYCIFYVHTSEWEKPNNWTTHQYLLLYASHWISSTHSRTSIAHHVSCRKVLKKSPWTFLEILEIFWSGKKSFNITNFSSLWAMVKTIKKYWLLFLFRVPVSTLIDFTCHGIFK